MDKPIADSNQKSSKAFEIVLIIVCWLIYSFAQLGRYSYSSNVTLIMDQYNVTKTVASLPTTLYFLAYGLGQIFIGFFCSKLNRKVVLTLSLLGSAISNVVLYIGVDFELIKWVWIFNGLCQAALWPSLMFTLRKGVHEKYKPFSAIMMSIASTGGMFLSYGLFALMSMNPENYTNSFLVSSIILALTSVLWFVICGILNKKTPYEDAEPAKPDDAAVQNQPAKKKGNSGVILLLMVFIEFSFVAYAVSGGLNSWVPVILKEEYGFEDWVAILTSVLLPLFMLSVSFITTFAYKKAKGFVLPIVVAYILTTVLLICAIFAINLSWIVLVVSFVLACISVGIVSNMTTVQVPLYMKGKFDAGFLAGILNGTCYVGRAFSTFILAVLADQYEWEVSFGFLAGLAALSSIIAIAFFIASKRRGEKI
ncbi:MAG: MFS transporter [Clostridiales bacterium]|nr:MFS transporter [Clostridiales bacterium]